MNVIAKLIVLLCMIPPTIPAKEKLTIRNLTGDFYIYTTYKDLDGFLFPSNSMYMVTAEGVVLFDTPWDTSQVIPLRDSIRKKHGKEISLCIVTHFHDDRTAGLKKLRSMGVATYSSEQTKKLCRTRNEKEAEFIFTKDTLFRYGGFDFETFYPGAGHSPDNIVIWFPAQKILYGGCFIKSSENKSLGNVADANPDEWKRSVRKTMKKYKAAEFIIPGHFSWTGDEHLRHTYQLLKKQAMKKR